MRADIFAFGVVLYELLTGAHPFKRDTTPETAAAILDRDPAPLVRHRQDLPQLLERVVSKMLAKAPTERYQRVDELRADLTPCQRTRLSSSRRHPGTGASK